MQATGTKGTMDFKQNKDGSGKMHIKMHDGREFKVDVGAAHRHQLSCFTGALLILSAVNWNFQQIINYKYNMIKPAINNKMRLYKIETNRDKQYVCRQSRYIKSYDY